MQKPLAAYANDLADHDVIDDDCDLIFGPHPSKLSTSCSVAPVPIGRPLLGGSTSFKTQHQDTSILGSAPVVAKLAQSLSVSSQPMRMARTSAPDSSHVYAGGNPIISATPASRAGSATPRLPRSSAPSGATTTAATTTAGGVQLPDPAAATSTAVHGGTAAGSETAAVRRQPEGVETRLQGDIQAGDRDTPSARPRSGLLRRLSSLTSGSRPPSRPPSAKQEAAEAGAAAPSSRAAANSPEGPAGRPPFAELSVPVRSAAIPCVDGEPERSRLLRRLSLREGAPAAAAPGGAAAPQALPKVAAGSVWQPTLLQAADARAAESQSGAMKAMSSLASAASAAAPSASAAAPERPLTPLRRLTRLLSGSLTAPSAAVAAAAAATELTSSDQRDQDGAGASKRRTSSAGMRELFSRPSSARRKSEAGPQGFQTQQMPMEAWTKQQQQRPSQLAGGCGDGPAGDRVHEFGVVVVRQPSGVFKRAASALAAKLAR